MTREEFESVKTAHAVSGKPLKAYRKGKHVNVPKGALAESQGGCIFAPNSKLRIMAKEFEEVYIQEVLEVHLSGGVIGEVCWGQCCVGYNL